MRFWFGWSDDSAYPFNMSASVYIESSVISYLTARTSRDLITASRQAITADWWQNKLRHYDAYISVLVIEEISAGHPEAASQRINAVAALPVVGISPTAQTLVGALLAAKAVPANSDVMPYISQSRHFKAQSFCSLGISNTSITPKHAR